MGKTVKYLIHDQWYSVDKIRQEILHIEQNKRKYVVKVAASDFRVYQEPLRLPVQDFAQLWEITQNTPFCVEALLLEFIIDGGIEYCTSTLSFENFLSIFNEGFYYGKKKLGGELAFLIEEMMASCQIFSLRDMEGFSTLLATTIALILQRDTDFNDYFSSNKIEDSRNQLLCYNPEKECQVIITKLLFSS